MNLRSKIMGYTLIEISVALAIIGILYYLFFGNRQNRTDHTRSLVQHITGVYCQKAKPSLQECLAMRQRTCDDVFKESFAACRNHLDFLAATRAIKQRDHEAIVLVTSLFHRCFVSRLTTKLSKSQPQECIKASYELNEIFSQRFTTKH